MDVIKMCIRCSVDSEALMSDGILLMILLWYVFSLYKYVSECPGTCVSRSGPFI